MTQEKLRYGIMCTGATFCKWQAEVIEELASLDNVELSVLIIDGRDSNVTFWEKVVNNAKKISPGKFLFQIYNKLFFSPPANEKVDMSHTVEGTDTISCEVRKEGRFSEYFKEDDIKQIDRYNLDFIIRFGFGIIRGEMLEVPKYGVWSFHHDDEKKYRGGPPCFWEIYKDDDVNGAILQRLTDRLDGGIVLRKGFFKTKSFSYSKNLSNVYMESAKWPTQICKDILNGNAEYFRNSPSKTNAPVYHQPNNFQFIFFIVKLFINYLKRWYRRLFTPIWNVGVLDKPIQFFLNTENSKNFGQVEWFPESKNMSKYRADPFGIIKGGKLTIAFEEYEYKAGKGYISGVQLDNEQNINSSLVSDVYIKQPFHLSYPYLIEQNGNTYCVPESFEENKISLYKAIDFPLEWKKAENLVNNIEALDTTIFQYRDKWWLTCTKNGSSRNTNLYIYWAKELIGPWKSHFNNPVKTDIRSSRPAGTPFVYNKSLYRPAQDCSKTYGGRVAINKVKSLSVAEFEEETVKYINPLPPYIEGIHTLSAVGDKTIVDGKKSRLSLGGLWRKLKKYQN